MALDAIQQNALVAHLSQRWKTQTCPMCGSSNWGIHGIIQLVLNSTGDAVINIAPQTLTMPTAAVLCQTCGNTVLVNLVIAGAVRR